MTIEDNYSLRRRVAELERKLDAAMRRAETVDHERNRHMGLLERLPQPVYETDTKGNLTYANTAAFGIFGYTREDMDRGLNVLQLVTPDCRDIARENIGRFLSGEVSVGNEYTALRKDGSTFPVIIHSIPFHDEGGNLRGLQGLIVDISRRKEMELALRESETRYRRLVEMSPDIVYEMRVFRPDITPAEKQRVIAAVGRLRGVEPEELNSAIDRERKLFDEFLDLTFLFSNLSGAGNQLGSETSFRKRGIPEVVAPEEVETAVRNTLRALVERRRSGMEYAIIDRSGVRFPVSVSTSLILDEYPYIIEGVARDIRYQRDTEIALRESEQRYREIFHAVPVSIWEYDFQDVLPMLQQLRSEAITDFSEYFDQHPDLIENILSQTRLADVNDETIRLYGAKTKEDIFSASYQHNHISEAKSAYINALVTYLKGGNEFSCETVNLTVDGRRIDVIIRMSFSDELAVSGRALVTVSDITERKRMERALRKSEERFRKIFNTVPVSIREYDFTETIPLLEQLAKEGHGEVEAFLDAHPERLMEIVDTIRLVDFNDETIRLYGGLTREDIFHAYGRHRIAEVMRFYRAMIAAWVRGDSEIFRETVNETIDGRRIRISLHVGLPRRGESETALATAADITGLKRAEQALRESELKFRSIVEHSPDGIVVVNEEGSVIEWNRGAEVILGLSREKVQGRPLWEVNGEISQTTDPITREKLHDQIAESLRTGRVAWNPRAVDLPIHRPDGVLRFVQYTASTVKTERGHMIIATFHDITERKRIEEERLRADKLESLGLLAGGIAHDFNNILGAVLGNISLARALLNDNGELQDILTGAENAGFRARDLTRQLLTFSRGGAPVKESASMVEIIRESAEFSLRGSNVRCEYAFPDDLWPVEVDRGQMSQVVNNLILNALQAMPQGGTIKIAGENVHADDGEDSSGAGGMVHISIQDFGVGISHENMARIFDPYFTTKATGNGLGLTTTYSIIRNHNGRIEVESEPGVGTVFHVYLPATDITPAMEPEKTALKLEAHARVLVMDDEPTIRLVLSRMLQHLGHDVVAVPDGAAAIEQYRKAMADADPFSAVIMDLTVPGGMGGLEATRRLHEVDPQCRVIVSSGYSEHRIAGDFRSFGFRAVLTKPYRMEELVETLNRVLRDE